MYCVAITKKGSKCTNMCKYDDHCGIHRTLPECPICYEQITAKSKVETSCKHLFHSGCLGEWKLRGNNSCPLCRSELEKSKPQSLFVNVSIVYIDPLPDGQYITYDEDGTGYIHDGELSANTEPFQFHPTPEGWSLFASDNNDTIILARDSDIEAGMFES
jgi:hypothetical protein